jgi:hypothetical protein
LGQACRPYGESLRTLGPMTQGEVRAADFAMMHTAAI